VEAIAAVHHERPMLIPAELKDAIRAVTAAKECGSADDERFALGHMVDVIGRDPALWALTFDALTAQKPC